MQGVLDRGAFAKELGVGSDVDPHPLSVPVLFALDHLREPGSGVGGHGRLLHEYQILRCVGRDVATHGFDETEIRTAPG